jgi:hypothetical protein
MLMVNRKGVRGYEDFVEEVGQPIHQRQGDDFFSTKSFIEFNDKMFVPVITDIAKSDHITGYSNKLGITHHITHPHQLPNLTLLVLTHLLGLCGRRPTVAWL